MTKKDYTAIAELITTELDYSLEHGRWGEAEGIRVLASKLCDYFNETNPRFSERQFMDAIGIDHKSARV